MVDRHACFSAQEFESALSGCNLAAEPWMQALLLLLQTVEQQGGQIRRLEGIVAAETFKDTCNSSIQHSPTSLAISLAHKLQSTQHQVKQLQEQSACSQQQYEAAINVQKNTAEQLHKLECRTQELELQQQSMQRHMGIANMSGNRLKFQSQQSRAQEPAGSVAGRLQHLEQRVKCLSQTTSNIQEHTQASAAAVHKLEQKVSQQVHNIREDTKHAISVATSAACCVVKAEIQADMSQAVDMERRVEQKLNGVVGTNTNSPCSRRQAAASSVLADLDARVTAIQDAQQQHLSTVLQQLKKLADEKADMHLLTAYTKQVNEVFEQLSTTLVDTAQTSNAELVSKQQRLCHSLRTLTASKADVTALTQLQQEVEKIRTDLAAVSADAASATASAAAAKRLAESVNILQLDLADVQGTVGALLAENTRSQSCSGTHEQLLREHGKQLQCLCSKQIMLQEQLAAFTNHVDPAAAAVLAATSAVTAKASTSRTGPKYDKTKAEIHLAALPAVSHAGSSTPDMSTLQQLLFEQSSSSLQGPQLLNEQTSTNAQQPSTAAQPLVVSSQQGVGAADNSSSMAQLTTPGVVRHMPLSMRLCLVENGLQGMEKCLAAKASAGDMAALTMHVGDLCNRLSAIADSLKGMHSSSIKRLERQGSSMQETLKSLADALQERPSHNQVLDMMQQAAATGSAEACQQAVTAIQQELQTVRAQMEAAKKQLTQAQHDINSLQEVQASMGKAQETRMKILQDQLQQWQDRIQQMDSNSKQAAAEAIKKGIEQQTVGEKGPHKQLKQQVASLTAKWSLLDVKLEGLMQDAASARSLQDQQTAVVAALQTKISAHISRCPAPAGQQQLQQHQQLLEDLTAQLEQIHTSHNTRLAALESAAKAQADAMSELAEVVAAFPGKDVIREDAVADATAAAQNLMQEHKQEEEDRWEVWLSEFARALKERPTTSQVQQQIQSWTQQQATSASDAEQLADPAAADSTVAPEDGLSEQLRLLDMRLDTLEEGFRCCFVSDTDRDKSDTGVHACDAVSVPDDRMQDKLPLQQQQQQQLAEFQIQLAQKADKADLQEQVASMTQKLQDNKQQLQDLQQRCEEGLADLVTCGQVEALVMQHMRAGEYVDKQELQNMLQSKLDIEVFLASVAASKVATVMPAHSSPKAAG